MPPFQRINYHPRNDFLSNGFSAIILISHARVSLIAPVDMLSAATHGFTGVWRRRWQPGHLRIVLLVLSVLLVIQVLSLLLRVMLRFLGINVVESLGLDELVDLGSGEPCEKLLGESVVDRLA